MGRGEEKEGRGGRSRRMSERRQIHTSTALFHQEFITRSNQQ